MADENNEKTGLETTEGAKRQEKLDSFKRTMRNVREKGKLLMLVGVADILLVRILSELDASLPALAWFALKVFPLIAVGTWYFSHSFKMVYQWENGVIFRLGRVKRTHPKTDAEIKEKVWKFVFPLRKKKRENGESYWVLRPPVVKTVRKLRKGRWTFIFWPLDEIVFVNMWERRIDIPPQKVIIKEMIKVQKKEKPEEVAIRIPVDVIFYFKINNAAKALTAIEGVDGAVKDLVLSLLRKKCAELDIGELVSGKSRKEKQKRVAESIKKMLNEEIKEQWGVEITKAEFKDVILPEDIQKAYNLVFETEKGREAKIVEAHGEEVRIETVYGILAKMDPNLVVRGLEALEKMAQGKASTIFTNNNAPSVVQDLISAIKGAKESAFASSESS